MGVVFFQIICALVAFGLNEPARAEAMSLEAEEELGAVLKLERNRNLRSG